MASGAAARLLSARGDYERAQRLHAQGAAHLRQVRLGPVLGTSVAVLSGLQAGERVAINPIAAARP